ncbi:MAG: hypothetical protein D6696_04150 [Acidobacteria bacterium]|nr:MAG: hypothetical protein D6696_04150 [Acidobacteriota bacterium]
MRPPWRWSNATCGSSIRRSASWRRPSPPIPRTPTSPACCWPATSGRSTSCNAWRRRPAASAAEPRRIAVNAIASRPLRVAVAVVALLLLPAAGLAQREIERTVAASAGGTVEVTNVAGSVAVRGWDRAQVEVSGTVERRVEEVRVESRDGRTVVEVVLARRGRGDGEAFLELRVPRGSSLRADLVSAEISVDEVDGRIEIETVSGPQTIAGRPAAVVARTVSGRVDIEAAAPRIEASAVSGDLRVTGGASAVEVSAEAVSGDVELTLGAVERLQVETVSGDVEVSCALAPGGRLAASTNSGDLELALPADASARITVTTFSGDVDNELGPPAERANRYTPEKILDFTLGGGDGRVQINTFSGDVTLRRR